MCFQKSEIVGYGGVGGLAKIGYPIFNKWRRDFDFFICSLVVILVLLQICTYAVSGKKKNTLIES